ncbi:hypothetical protein SCHPADRAFT_477926 [Schizopora paradoxa]|uniref:Uncharacterized protein n=1 Tax=Schizopora paradoxa TaxID=27342 RepID=A0A0H2RHC2_9AGAM|nr:hypothetical protein SCHPADRAFT_477926 [Schizopora paradoxa]
MLSLQAPRFSTANSLQLPSLPGSSPTMTRPAVHEIKFDTHFSRDPARIRAVYEDVVERTKAMNLDKPKTSKAKKLATMRGLCVDIAEAKSLHWKSIQARAPVVLTAGLNSPPRTPRRPAMNYPSAATLYLINEAEAKNQQQYGEARRWKSYADRERAITRWEKNQAGTQLPKIQPLAPRKRHAKAPPSIKQPQPRCASNATDMDALRRSAEALQALFDEANRSALTSLEENAKKAMASSSHSMVSTHPNGFMLQTERPLEFSSRPQGSENTMLPYAQDFNAQYTLGQQDTYSLTFGSTSMPPLNRTNATLDLPQLHQPIPKLALKMAPAAIQPRVEPNLDYSGLLSSEAYFGQTTEAFEKPQYYRQDSVQSTTSSIATLDGGMSSDFSTGSSSSLGPLTPAN